MYSGARRGTVKVLYACLTICCLLVGLDAADAAAAAPARSTAKAAKNKPKKRKPATAGKTKKAKQSKPAVMKVSFDAPSSAAEEETYTPEDYTGRNVVPRRNNGDGYNVSPAEAYRPHPLVHPLHRKEGASSKRPQSNPDLDEIEAKLDPQNAKTIHSQNHARSLPARSGFSERLMTDDQTALHPIPRARMLVIGGYTSGKGHQIAANGVVLGSLVAVKSTLSGFHSGAQIAYGFNDYLYVRAEGAYAPERTEATIVSNSSTFNNARTVAISDGWREPTIALGATARVAGEARVSAEVEGAIPVGSAKLQEVGQETRTNGLDGGGAITPRLIAVAKIPGVKLVGTARYTFRLERQAERTVQGLAAGTQTTTGGNSLELLAGVEIPAAFNLGLAGAFSQEESSSTVFSLTQAPSASSASASVASSGRAVPMIGGMAYMGIPIDAVRMTFVPKASYFTATERRANGLNVDQADVWSFGVHGLLNF